jgi:large subunit ribosomal protein L31e
MKMAEKENKIVLEREYIVPLRAGWLKAQKYKRGNRAIKELKLFLVRHMKVYDRDTRKIKVDILLNNELRFRGIKKPQNKIKIKAIKYDNGEVVVKLAELSKHMEFELAKKVKTQARLLKLQNETKAPEIKQEKKEEAEAKTEDAKEKEASSKDAELKLEKTKAKEAKHTSKTSQETPKIQRKALQK